nr:uncharacterized mitochondrial protein AtMg00810-like [Tanacetum cinerariifolium]
TIVATSTTGAEYVAATSGCGQVLWIQNQLLDYGRVVPRNYNPKGEMFLIASRFPTPPLACEFFISGVTVNKCLRCDQPCYGYYCYSCTCPRCGMNLLNGTCNNCIYGDGKSITCNVCEGMKLLEDLKELAEYVNSPSRNRSNFLNDNEDHFVQNPSNEIASSNSNQEKEGPPQDSDIHQLIREECGIEVYEIKKSGVEELAPILSENEVTLEDKKECDVPVYENSLICDDHFEIFSDYNNDEDISSDDDNFEDIEYVEASLSDPEIVSVAEENVVYREDDDSIPFSNNESSESDFDNPSVPRPPPEQPDADFKPDSGNEISVVMNINDKLECLNPRDEFYDDDYFPFIDEFYDDDYFPFMFVIYSKMFLSFLSAESEDTIFDPDFVESPIEFFFSICFPYGSINTRNWVKLSDLKQALRGRQPMLIRSSSSV